MVPAANGASATSASAGPRHIRSAARNASAAAAWSPSASLACAAVTACSNAQASISPDGMFSR